MTWIFASIGAFPAWAADSIRPELKIADFADPMTCPMAFSLVEEPSAQLPPTLSFGYRASATSRAGSRVGKTRRSRARKKDP